MLLAIATLPAMLGTQEAIHQGQRKERREEHRARRCNLVVSCTKSSVRSRDINGRPVVLKNNKLYINTGFATSLTEPSAHPFAGYFLPYPDTKYEGLVSTITNVAPILNWIYVDKDTYEIKYNVRAEAQPHLTGPFDCTRQDRRLTFESWEGFVAVEELPAVWALYFDRDDNGLRGKVPRGTRVLEITLTRTERKRDKGDADREKEEARQAREGLKNPNANTDAGQAEKSAAAVAQEPGTAQASNGEVITEEGGLHRSPSMEREALIQSAAKNGLKPQKARLARDAPKEMSKTDKSNGALSPKVQPADEAGKESTAETRQGGEGLTHEQKGNLKTIEKTLAKLSPFGAIRSSKTSSTKDGTQEVRFSNKQEEKPLSPQSTPAETGPKDGLKSKEQKSQIKAVEKALKTLSPLGQLADLKKSEGEPASAAAEQHDDTASSTWGENSALWSDQEQRAASKNAVQAEPFTPASSVHGDITTDEEPPEQSTPVRNTYQKPSVRDATDNDALASEKTPTREKKSPARQAPKRPDLKSNLSATDTTAPDKSHSTGSAATPVPRAPQDAQTEPEKTSTTKVSPPYRPSVVEQTATQPRPVARKRAPEVKFAEPEKTAHSGPKKDATAGAALPKTPTKSSPRGRAVSPSLLAETPTKSETVSSKGATPLVKKDSQQGSSPSDVSPQRNTSKAASTPPSSKKSLLPQPASPSPKSRSPKSNPETSSSPSRSSPNGRPSTPATALSQAAQAGTPKATASTPANAWLSGMGNPMHIPALEPPETDAASIKTLLVNGNGNGNDNGGSTGEQQPSQHQHQDKRQRSVSPSVYSTDDTAVAPDSPTPPKADETPSASTAGDSTNQTSPSPSSRPSTTEQQQQQAHQHERNRNVSSSTTATTTTANTEGRGGSELGSVHSGTTMAGTIGADSLAGATQDEDGGSNSNSNLNKESGNKSKTGGWRSLGSRLTRKDTGGKGGVKAGVFGRKKEKGGSVG